MKTRILAVLFAACLLTSACSDGAAEAGSPTGNVVPDSGTTTPPGKKAFKTHVILGDSISDRGGQGPFFYDLLDKNDDAKWPDAAGKDLTTVYGAGLKVVKTSKAGARAQNLQAQINAVGTSLPGPVLVTITIGGNDVTTALGKIITGGDDTSDRATFKEALDGSIALLKTPDRFGPGVEVSVYMTNVYDPSDGTGNFKFASGTKCGGALGFYPAGMETASRLEPWEQIFDDVAAKYQDVYVLDLRAKFTGHGVPAAETWFVPDCIHPNTPGHDGIRDLFWEAITK